MRRSIAIALAALISGCSQSTPPEPKPQSTLKFYVRGHGPCENDFVQITTALPACGIALQTDGSLTVGGHRTAPIIVSHQQTADGETAIAAKKLVLFTPGLQSGFRVIQACEDVTESSLCWAVRLLNLRTGAMREIPAGKYGPQHWIRWSPQERRVALISRNEGAEWLHVIDTESGAATTYPDARENANWKIDRESFAWTSDDTFTVMVKTCETCAPEARNFTLP